MSKIRFQELKNDYDFLERLNYEHTIWKETDPKLKQRTALTTNFKSHPKRICSQADCAIATASPKHYSCDEIISKTVAIDFITKHIPPLEIDNIGDNVLNLPKIDSCGKQKVMPNRKQKPFNNQSNTNYSYNTNALTDYEFEKKNRIVIEKCMKLLCEIRAFFEKGENIPERDEDLDRRQKRMQEFSNRFSRVYLYPLLQTTNDLSLPLKPHKGSLNQKLISGHQLILQGLQAYFNHLPTSVGNYATDKLKSLLDQIVYMCELYPLLKRPSDYTNCEEDIFINALRSQVELVEQAAEEFIANLKLKEKKQENVDKNKKKDKPKKKASRFSMYGTTASFRQDLNFQKAVSALNAKKYNVKSRYKTALFKHRPPIPSAHTSKTQLTNHQEIAPKPIVKVNRSAVNTRTVDEDAIKTIVQRTTNSSPTSLDHEDVADKILRLVRAGCDNGGCNNNVDENELFKALQTLKECLGDNQDEVLNRVAVKLAKKNLNQLEFIENVTENKENEKGKQKKKE